jgi:hypothetical protein
MNSTEMRPGLTFIKHWPWVCTRSRNEQISTLYQINYLFWLDNFRVLGRFLYSYSLNSDNQNTVFKFKVFWLDNFRVLGRFVYSYSLNSDNQNTVFKFKVFWLDNFRVLGRFLYSYPLNSDNRNTVFKFKVFWLDDFRVRLGNSYER